VRDGKPTITGLHYATQYDDTAWGMGIKAGMDVDVSGFVTHPRGSRAGTFAVTRFVISCCVADARAYSAQLDARKLQPSSYADNTWLRVVGRTVTRGHRLLVLPSRIERIPAPKSPYLSR
jgi:putative membrane protein